MRGGPRRASGAGRLPGPGQHEEAAALQSGPQMYTPAMRPAPAAGGVFKSAAVEVLRRTRRLMTTGEICRLALEWGLLSCSGKTPEATMASAMYGDVKRKDRHSLFIRPQEGMFGLREWVEQGSLPYWQPDLASSGSGPLPHAFCATSMAGGSSTSMAGGFGNAGYTVCGGLAATLPAPEAAPAVVAPSPAKRSAPTSFAGTPHGGSAGGGSSRAPGRPKKAARRSRAGPHSDVEEDEWSHGGEQSDSEQQEGSDDERLEPKLYSLRKGDVGRLQQSMAAAPAGSGQEASTLTGHPAAQHAQQDQQAHHAHHAQQAQHPLGILELLELPNLRPHSAEGSRCLLGSGRVSSAGASGGGSAGGLFSPPLCATLLQSPLIPPASSAGRGGVFSSIFSPGTGVLDFRSPIPLLPSPLAAALGRTPACFSSLLSPFNPAEAGLGGAGQRPGSDGGSRQRRVAEALKGGAAAAAPGTAVSAMVPICEVAGDHATGAHHMQPQQQQHSLPLHYSQQQQQQQQQQQLGLPGQQHALGRTPVGESATGVCAGMGAGGAMFVRRHVGPPGSRHDVAASAAGIPAIVFNQGAPGSGYPGPVSSCSGQAAGPCHWQADGPAAGEAGGFQAYGGGMGGGGGGGSSSISEIAQKVREVEGKVLQVEERWGPLSLKTAQAHFLLHRACRHPQAAASFQREAAVALHRAHAILVQSSLLGLVDCQAADYLALMDQVQAAQAVVGDVGAAPAGGTHGAS